jgi:hypothetical protein
MLLNKAAVEAMGLKNPLGIQMRYGRTFTVIGVTDNVIMGSPFEPVDPMMVLFDPYGANSVSIRLKNSVQPQKVLGSIETIFKKYNPLILSSTSSLTKSSEKNSSPRNLSISSLTFLQALPFSFVV